MIGSITVVSYQYFSWLKFLEGYHHRVSLMIRIVINILSAVAEIIDFLF